MKDYPVAIRYLVRILLLFAVILILIYTKPLLVPLFFSVFLSYLLLPASKWLESKNIPRIVTNFIVIFSFMTLIGATGYILINLSGKLGNDLPELKEQLTQNITQLQSTIEYLFGISPDTQASLIKSVGQNGDLVTGLIQAGKNGVVSLALIPVYTFLILFYRDKFREFVSMNVKEENEAKVDDIIGKVSNVVPKYLKGLFSVCGILIVLNSLGFYLTGVKYFMLFGIIAAIFNLIPYLGTVLGYGIVFIFVLGVQSPGIAGAVAVQFFIIQFIENNILTPNITGSYVRINPLVTIFSLIAGGMVWGVPGMFLVIPILGIVKIVFESDPEWESYAFLLGTRGTEKHSITIKSLQKKFGWLENN